MKKFLLLIICLVLALCSATTVYAKTQTLIFSTMFPESYTYIFDPGVDFCKKVEARTNGEVKFDIFHSKQLFGGKEEFAAVGRGEIDVGIPHDIYHTGEVPELGITSLPFLFENVDQAMYMLRAGLKEKVRPILEKKNNCVILGWVVFDPYNLYSRKPITSMEDIKGKVWAVSGTTAAKAIELMGGSPTMMSSSELYLALQTKTIDGCVRPLITGVGRKLFEVADYWTQINLSPWGDILIVNKDKWDKLSPDAQKIMRQAGREWEDQSFLSAKEYVQTAVKKLKDGGMNISALSSDEIAKIQKAVAPLYKWWIEEEVPNGQEYLDFVESHR